MATSTSSSAKVPVSMMEVKKMVTGPGSSSESAYMFAMNILTLPCRYDGTCHTCGTQCAKGCMRYD